MASKDEMQGRSEASLLHANDVVSHRQLNLQPPYTAICLLEITSFSSVLCETSDAKNVPIILLHFIFLVPDSTQGTNFGPDICL